MTVEINSKPVNVSEGMTTLADLLRSLDLDRPDRAAAVDNSLVKRVDYSSTPLRDGMKIIVIKAVCGG